MGEKYYFLSDIHLGNRYRDALKEKKIIEFLRQLPADTAGLYLLGDIFDYWLEYRTVIFSRFFPVLCEMKKVHDSGIPVHFVVGNHDFAVGDFFNKYIPIDIHYDPVEININDKRIYLHHGDGISPKDRGYRLLKKILRMRFTRSILRWIHPDIAIILMHLLSGGSRMYTSHIDHGEKDAIREMSEKKLSEGFDAVITGHAHEPVAENGYYNLGDWQEHFSYLVLEGNCFELKFFK